MAHPLYMLCCQSGAVDQKSNQVSHFNVVERLQLNFQKAGVPAGSVPLITPLKLQIVSTWVRDKEDGPKQKFEVEIVFQKTGERPRFLHKGVFTFGESRNHRFTVSLDIIPRPDFKGGEYRFYSRIRKSGSKRWVRQEYSIPVDVNVIDEPQPASTNGKKRKRKKA